MTTATLTPGPTVTAISIDPDRFARALRVGHLFTANTGLGELDCLNITIDAGKLTLAATDRYGLAVATLDCGPGHAELLLRRRDAKGLAREIAGMARWRQADQPVELVVIDHGASVRMLGARCGHMESTVRTLATPMGHYPDVDALLAKARANAAGPEATDSAAFQPWTFWRLAHASRIVFPQARQRGSSQSMKGTALTYLTLGGPKSAAIAQLDWLTVALMPVLPRAGVAGYIAPAEPTS